jgi:hypothetical protein
MKALDEMTREELLHELYESDEAFISGMERMELEALVLEILELGKTGYANMATDLLRDEVRERREA